MSEAPLLQERLITHFAAENRRATFTPDRIFIETPGIRKPADQNSVRRNPGGQKPSCFALRSGSLAK